MNPLEDRIHKVALRKPDPAWRDEILNSASDGSFRRSESPIWPSPLAWAALVMIWLGLAIAAQVESRKERTASAAKPPRYFVVPDPKELRALIAQRR
jgi:hypothetical protein